MSGSMLPVTEEVYEEAGTAWAPWNQTENYARNGFVTGTVINGGVFREELGGGSG